MGRGIADGTEHMPRKPIDKSRSPTLTRKGSHVFCMGTPAARRVGGVPEGERLWTACEDFGPTCPEVA